MDRWRSRPKREGVLQGVMTMPVAPSEIYQVKMVTPGDKVQVIKPDVGYAGLRSVTVAAIPSNYGRVSFNGYELKVE